MLTIRDLKLTVGGRTLFEHAAMQVNYGERVALVGPNGAGKSTLFSAILGQRAPDAGTVERDEWTMVGYLPQESEPAGAETVLDLATGRTGEVPLLEARLKELEAAGDVSSPAYLEAHAKHEALDNPQVEAKAKKMLAGLGYRITRLHPARARDERRLDHARAPGAAARHGARSAVARRTDQPPRPALAVVAAKLPEDVFRRDPGHLARPGVHGRRSPRPSTTWPRGGWCITRAIIPTSCASARPTTNSRSPRTRTSKRRSPILQEFYERFRQVASKASQAQSKLKQIERMEKIDKPVPPKKPFRFQIPEPPRGGQRALSLENIHMAYGEHVVYRGLNLEIERGERTVLVGPNGAGKSTLLKILAGVLPFQKGERREGHNSRIGYFSQHRADTLTVGKSVLEEVMDSAPTVREDEARAILGSFLFRKDDIYKKTEVLSGGEKSRLNLIKFLVDPPNLLLMDEPTTHLDILTVESLVLALERYAGTLVFISHDVYFIRKLATKVLHVSAGKVAPYVGGYDYFLEKTAGALEDERAALTAG